MRPVVLVLQILTLLLVLALLGAGLYFAFRFTADLYASYAPLLGTTAKAVIVAVALVGILLALVIHRATAQRRAAALFDARLRLYNELVEGLVGTPAEPGFGASAERRLLLVADRRVLRAWRALRKLDLSDEDDQDRLAERVDRVITEMRRELGARGFDLGSDELGDVLLTDDSGRWADAPARG